MWITVWFGCVFRKENMCSSSSAMECVYVLRLHHKGASITHSIVCVCMYIEYMYVYWHVYGVYVCEYLHVYLCMCMCIYVFACGWIYGVGVVQPKTRYLTWRLQYRLQLMVKETAMFQRAKIEIIEVSVMLLEIVTWHELQWLWWKWKAVVHLFCEFLFPRALLIFRFFTMSRVYQ